MPRLTWGGSGHKIFESGVDRGVIYPESGSLGVPWNGLLSVTRNPNGGAATQYFLDGQLRTTLITPEHFAGTVDAYTYPDALAVADGTAAEATGLSFGLQPRKRFGMTWRTGIGNDVNGIDAGYKIHILYNALAIPTPKGHKTRGVDNAPSTFNWNIVGHPVEVANRRNTSYLVIDSTKANPATIKILEYMLYGSDNTSARLPTPSQVKTLFDNWAGIYVAPFVVHEKSKVFRNHPRWILKDYHDDPIEMGEDSDGKLYALDGTHEDVKDYIGKVFRNFRKMGFTYYELDYLEWGLKDSSEVQHSKKGKSSVQILRAIMEIIREEIGAGSFITANKTPYSPMIGYVDAVRIDRDHNWKWDDETTGHILAESYNTQYFNNVFWQVFLVFIESFFFDIQEQHGHSQILCTKFIPFINFVKVIINIWDNNVF